MKLTATGEPQSLQNEEKADKYLTPPIVEVYSLNYVLFAALGMSVTVSYR